MGLNLLAILSYILILLKIKNKGHRVMNYINLSKEVSYVLRHNPNKHNLFG